LEICTHEEEAQRINLIMLKPMGHFLKDQFILIAIWDTTNVEDTSPEASASGIFFLGVRPGCS
jgi:hypothetical protein